MSAHRSLVEVTGQDDRHFKQAGGGPKISEGRLVAARAALVDFVRPHFGRNKFFTPKNPPLSQNAYLD